MRDVIYFRKRLSRSRNTEQGVKSHVPCSGEWASRKAELDQRLRFELHHRFRPFVRDNIIIIIIIVLGYLPPEFSSRMLMYWQWDSFKPTTIDASSDRSAWLLSNRSWQMSKRFSVKIILVVAGDCQTRWFTNNSARYIYNDGNILSNDD